MEKKVCTQLVCACTLAFSLLPSFGFGSATKPCMHCLFPDVFRVYVGISGKISVKGLWSNPSNLSQSSSSHRTLEPRKGVDTGSKYD